MQCSRFEDDRLREEKMEVLYGEADAETRARVEEHRNACGACREEWAAFTRLRRELGAWSLPATHPVPIRLAHRIPRFLVAAAVLLLALAGGLGLSGSELRFQDGRFAFRLGRADPGLRLVLNQQEARAQQRERRYREEIEALKASLRRASPDEQALLAHLERRVDDKIRASEARQGELFRTALDDWSQKSEARRRYDLARVAAGLSYLDGKNGMQMARTTELMGYLLEASQKR